ncbi:tetratricopeptide repeat protein [Archangium violaceum]|uniref:tetratricopeptide repeat protein n=1 Tax=Archangium violaceum TaxID=83451 RepID=UPI00193B0114|nr:tetratricopeptide repeat protein [Archangium violaceum]QRK09283.1 tetratricopeptide repeat protein [Archangium violaceum]
MTCPDETTLSDFLEGLLPEDSRARVLAHVEDCAGCQRALAAGEDSAPGSSAPEVPDGTLPPLTRGATVSRYVVLERIGQGAMGVVYAAYDPELDRQVALKLLRPEGRHVEELRRRLLREAQSLARLSHPNVVSAHDVGTCGDGLFLTMDLVEGTTLAEWLKQPRPWREVLRVFLEAGRGLAAAHAAGLVHRDFKPANVLVGHNGQVRVTDFGLASSSGQPDAPTPRPRPESARENAATPLTRTGALLGTPAYMAPEQLQGNGASALSDQFSFCVALHEALHGERPYQGHTPEELAQAALEGRVRPPGRESKVPSWVRRAVRRGLRARPEERFPSMETLLAAISPRALRVRTWVAVSAATASLVGLAVGYEVAHRREVRCAQEAEKLATVWGPEQRERVRTAFLSTGKPYAASIWENVSAALDAHAARWRELRTETCMASSSTPSTTGLLTAACLDTQLWQFAAITEVLRKADAQTVQNAPQMMASLEGLTGCHTTPALVTRPQPPDDLRPRVDAVRRRLAEARARMDAGSHAQGLEVTSALVPQARNIGYRPLEAEVLVLHGQLHGLVGKLQEAEEILYRALWAADAGRDDETVARVWLLLIWVVGEQKARMDEAERLVHHARAAVERLGKERFPAITIEFHLRMGGLLLVQGKLDEADAEFSRGLSLSRELYGPESLRTAHFLSSLGRVRTRQQRGPEAVALFRQAQTLRERIWGPDHPGHALNLSNLASELLWMGQPEEALATFRRSLALLESSRAPDHPSLATPLNNLAALLRRRGQLDESRRYFQRALAIFERTKGPDHPNTAAALCGLGYVESDAQRFDEALAHGQEALTRVERALGPDTPRAASPLECLGHIALQAGRYEQARRYLTRALHLLDKEYGPDNATATTVLRDLARVELATGAPHAALVHCERARMLDEKAQGAESPDAALGLACMAEVHLALGAPEQAVPLLEHARRIHQRAPLDLLDESHTTFLLARALWERHEAPAQERAAALAEEARALLSNQKPRGTPELRQVMDWIARHPPRAR